MFQNVNIPVPLQLSTYSYNIDWGSVSLQMFIEVPRSLKLSIMWLSVVPESCKVGWDYATFVFTLESTM